MTTANGAEPLLDIAELAERLNVGVRFIRRLITERRVPYIKLGHYIRFDPQAIEAWIDESRIDESPAWQHERRRHGRHQPDTPQGPYDA